MLYNPTNDKFCMCNILSNVNKLLAISMVFKPVKKTTSYTSC